MHNETREARQYYRARFEGSVGLFRKCWRRVLEIENANGSRAHEEGIPTLDLLAADEVKDERSPYYMYG